MFNFSSSLLLYFAKQESPCNISMIVGYQNFIFCSFPVHVLSLCKYKIQRLLLASSICFYDWQCAIIFNNSQLKTRDNEGSWMFAFHLTPPFSTSNTSEASSNIISEGIVKGRIYLLQIKWKTMILMKARVMLLQSTGMYQAILLFEKTGAAVWTFKARLASLIHIWTFPFKTE